MDAAVASLTLLAAGQAHTLMTSPLPSVLDLRDVDSDDGPGVDLVHSTQAVGAVIALAVGAGASAAAKSPAPLVATATVVALIFATQQRALASPTIADQTAGYDNEGDHP
jgi:hypothetical protein